MSPHASQAIFPVAVFVSLVFAGLVAWLAAVLRANLRLQKDLSDDQAARNFLLSYARSQGYADGTEFALRAAFDDSDKCRRLLEACQAAVAVHEAFDAPPADAA